MNNKNLIYKYLFWICNIMLGFTIIVYILYRRFLIIRLPKDLTIVVENNVKFPLLLFIVISLIICTYILWRNIQLLFDKTPRNTYFSIFSNKFSNIIDDSLSEFYSFTLNLLNVPYDKISLVAQKFYKYFKNIGEYLFLFISYGIRFIILTGFLIDVFIFFRLNYMYKLLYLLIISLLIKLLFYILKDFTSNLEVLKSALIITKEAENAETQLPTYSYEFKNEFKQFNLEYHVGQYILCNKVSGYLYMYDRYSNFFTPRINIVIYGLYLIGWSYVIYINIISII